MMRHSTRYDDVTYYIVTPGQLVSPTGGGGTGGHTDGIAATCHISLTHSRRRKVTGLIMTGLPWKTFSKLFSCMAVIMLVIMYSVGLLDRDMHPEMFTSENQPRYGLDFHLSYEVNGRRRKTTKRKEASRSAQSFGWM